ncbi:MAG: sugar ABC transporter permease [Chloroflexi bacterium]|nr:sugar ABC transporter permease [Chloroflexota bacterium]
MASGQARTGLSMRTHEAISGWLWASPWVLGFLIFTLGPMVWSFYLAFTRYSITNTPVWVGLDNFTRALSGDDSLFWGSMQRTLTWAFVMVPIGIGLSFLVAVLLNQKLRGTVAFRTVFFLPSLTPIVALALIWRWLYHPEFGGINYLLWELFRIEGPKWLSDSSTAMPALMIAALWATIGGATMIIFLAGLQGVPIELHEAASIDGATAWHRLRHITLPLMTPTIFFNLVVGIIAALKVFALSMVATGGGPNYATWFFNLHLYQSAFQNFEFGYASALAWIFFVLVVTLTYINVRSSRRWVYYEGEDRA